MRNSYDPRYTLPYLPLKDALVASVYAERTLAERWEAESLKVMDQEQALALKRENLLAAALKYIKFVTSQIEDGNMIYADKLIAASDAAKVT